MVRLGRSFITSDDNYRKKWTPCLNFGCQRSLIALCLSFSAQEYQFWLIGDVLVLQLLYGSAVTYNNYAKEMNVFKVISQVTVNKRKQNAAKKIKTCLTQDILKAI